MSRTDEVAEAASSFSGDPERPDLWIISRTDASFDALADHGPVTEAERARAARLVGDEPRRGYLARRAATRRILGAYLGRPADSVDIVTLPGGKPTFLPRRGDARRLSYSSTHSGELFCLAVAVTKSVGVDVEQEREVRRASAIAERWFSEDEAAMLDGTPFLEVWTGKEALAKRHSAGLRLLRRGAGELDFRRELEAGYLRHVRPIDGYVVAVASTTRIAALRVLGLVPAE